VRARGITTAEGDCLWAHYWQLPIEFVDSPEMRSRAWQIADQFSLPTLYDATFLACAELTGAQFWTADRTLLRSLGDHRPEYVHAVEPRP
jgi:predicted nucleic acid-binding protein